MTAAKRLVFGVVGIDMLAGPSEIVIVCDGNTPVEWITMDLFSQAEHDEEARAILISPDAAFLDRVETAIESMLPSLERAGNRRSLARRPWRADRSAWSRRGARARQPPRPRTPRAVGDGPAASGSMVSAMPGPSSSAPIPRRRSVTTARVRTMCCRPDVPRASLRRSGSMIFKSVRASSAARRAAPGAWRELHRHSRAARVSPHTRARPSSGARAAPATEEALRRSCVDPARGKAR